MFLSKKYIYISLAATATLVCVILLTMFFHLLILLVFPLLAVWLILMLHCARKMRCPVCGKGIPSLNALYLSGYRKVHCCICGTEIEIR